MLKVLKKRLTLFTWSVQSEIADGKTCRFLHVGITGSDEHHQRLKDDF